MYLTPPLNRASLSSYICLLVVSLLGSILFRPDALQFAEKQNTLDQLTDYGSMTALQIDVPGIFTYPVLQQPEDNDVYVSNRRNSLTQFRMAAREGITGVLAHNYLSGSDFYRLHVGQKISVLYDHEKIGQYQVTHIHRYQKLEPANLRSDLIDLETNLRLTTPEVYNLHYRGHHQLILQTCLEGEGRLDWGLLFVMAEPTGENP